tara:strand:- start:261 stop:506 length:246 start_codon:yes stop_codon:yes gene_type:complete
MSELNEDKIKERLEVLENDIKRVSEQMVSLDKQKSDAIAMLNALNGAKQQCQSFLNDLNNGDQPTGQEEDSKKSSSESDDS